MMQPTSPLTRLNSQKQVKVFGGGAAKQDRSVSFGYYNNDSSHRKRTNSELNSSVPGTDEQPDTSDEDDEIEDGDVVAAGKAGPARF